MKRFVLSTLVVSVLLVHVSIVTAQLPRLQVYFDADFTETYAYCPEEPPGTVVQEIYFVAHDFNMWMSAIEFRVLYPPQMIFLGDIVDDGGHATQLHLGTSPTGIAVAWTIPANAFAPLLVSRASILWMCQGCADNGGVVCFDVYPSSGKLRAVRWPDEAIVYGFGQAGIVCHNPNGYTPVICPDYAIPVEQSTWGSIKALYVE